MGTSLRNRIIIFFAILLVAFAFLAPTIWRDAFGDRWISRPISLGLDLSGGVHLVYEVETREAVTSRLQTTATAIRSYLREQRIAVTRARVNQANEIEISLLSDRLADDAQNRIGERFRELSFLRQTTSNGTATLHYGMPQAEAERIEREAMNQAVETLRNRVDQFGVAEPIIQRAGATRILLQMPGVQDVETVKQVVGSVARLDFRLLPTSPQSHTITLLDRFGGPVEVEDEVLMSGDAVDTARVEIIDGQVQVSLTLTSEGGSIFRRITTENRGRNLAIILDGVLYSSPVIRETITGGRASISGGFDMEEARNLAIVLRAGALPAPLHVLEERTVGPTLGAESIRKGVLAIIAGFIMVIIFMVVYYQKSGMIAVSTLIINIFLVMAALSAFGATLTLPGLAGLALTVGMAVDANVIIFERIREELENGSGRDSAVAAGFERALKAIIDANITTLLVGLILYYFGTGPIRGFAVTLSIGILTTLFCATFVARLGYDFFELKRRDGKLSI